MALRPGQHIGNKVKKDRVITADKKLRAHMPRAVRYRKDKLFSFLNRHSTAYVKPVYGIGGGGIVRVKKVKDGYKVRYGVKRKFYKKKKKVIKKIKQKKGNKPYYIQQGLDLITINGKPVDFRIVLHKTPQGWRYMGALGKIAAGKRFVTNHSRGGVPITLDRALKKSMGLNQNERKKIKKQMKQFCFRSARRLGRRFPRIRELGFDMGVDKNGKVWLIEANTRPGLKLFRKHPNRKVYRRMARNVRKFRG